MPSLVPVSSLTSDVIDGSASPYMISNPLGTMSIYPVLESQLGPPQPFSNVDYEVETIPGFGAQSTGMDPGWAEGAMYLKEYTTSLSLCSPNLCLRFRELSSEDHRTNYLPCDSAMSPGEKSHGHWAKKSLLALSQKTPS